MISNNLKWELNTDIIVKKAQQRLYFLRRLRSFGLSPHIMFTFHRATVESVLTFSVTVWFGTITVKEKLRLNRVVKTASRIIGRDLPSLESLYQQRLLGRAIFICHDSSHPAKYTRGFLVSTDVEPTRGGGVSCIGTGPSLGGNYDISIHVSARGVERDIEPASSGSGCALIPTGHCRVAEDLVYNMQMTSVASVRVSLNEIHVRSCG